MEKSKKISPKIQKIRYNLLQKIHSNDTSNLKAKVAYILNHYPKTRNNDQLLMIKIWQTFYPEKIIDNELIKLKEILNMPKGEDIRRYRAKIQNDLGLFLPSIKVQKIRKFNQDRWKDKNITKDTPKITVFTSQNFNEKCFIIGSLWIYNKPKENIERKIADKLISVQKNKRLPNDLSFVRVNSRNLTKYQDFFDSLLEFKNNISFKVQIMKAYLKQLHKEYILYEKHILNSIDFEINIHRIFPPKIFALIKSNDKIPNIAEWGTKQQIKKNITQAYMKDMLIDDIYSLKISDSPLLKIVDFFINSINIAFENGGKNSVQDYLAGYILGQLDINPLDLSYYGENNFVSIEIIDTKNFTDIQDKI